MLRTVVAAALIAPMLAAPALIDGTVVTARTAADYPFRTYQRHWAVVAVQSSATADWDLALRDGAGTVLATSLYGTGRADFVAIDSTATGRPLGSYTAAVTQYRPGVYWVQQHIGGAVLTLPPVTPAWVTGPADPDLAFSVLATDDVATVADLYLTAGESFWAHTTTAASALFLVHSDPAQPATFVQGRGTAAGRQQTQVLDGCTRYTAQRTGWHALVQIGDRAPATTDPVSGTAYALHRANPATPDKCPQRNFPAPTP